MSVSREAFRACGAVRAAIKSDLRELDPGPGALVLVACSGGADSLALAAGLTGEAREVVRSTRRRGYRINVGAIVVDHGLLPDSDRIADRAAQQCTALGLDPVVVRRVLVAGPGGPEAAARAARYAAFDRVAAELNPAAIYLGHTQTDQAETVLLGLARGSGINALTGMPTVRGLYRRPLLGLDRATTELACAGFELSPWRDPTNSPGSPALRSQVRHQVLPVLREVLGPGIVPALARSAELVREDAEVLNALAEELYRAALVATGDTDDDIHAPARSSRPRIKSGVTPEISQQTAGIVLDIAVLAAAPAALRRRVYLRAAITVGVPHDAISAKHLGQIDTLVANWHGQQRIDLPIGVIVWWDCGRLVFSASD